MVICPTSSSPGTDQITYLHLKNLPSTHCFLATLFSKILMESHKGPSLWFSAEIVLIPKVGDPSNPSNFRPNCHVFGHSQTIPQDISKTPRNFPSFKWHNQLQPSKRIPHRHHWNSRTYFHYHSNHSTWYPSSRNLSGPTCFWFCSPCLDHRYPCAHQAAKWTDLAHLGWIHQTVCNCEDQGVEDPPI